MARKAVSAKAKNPAREVNRKARQERRDEIATKWHDRNIERRFVVRIAGETDFYRKIDTLIAFCEEGESTFNMRLIKAWVDGENLEDPTWYFALIAAELVEIIRLKEMPYDEYLQSDHWKRVAGKAKARFDYACALDDRHDAVDAHHRTYVRRGHEYANDVIPLCRECHTRHHKRGT